MLDLRPRATVGRSASGDPAVWQDGGAGLSGRRGNQSAKECELRSRREPSGSTGRAKQLELCRVHGPESLTTASEKKSDFRYQTSDVRGRRKKRLGVRLLVRSLTPLSSRFAALRMTAGSQRLLPAHFRRRAIARD